MNDADHGTRRKLRQYKDQTESLVADLQSALSKFEKSGNLTELNDEIKESVKQFQEKIP